MDPIPATETVDLRACQILAEVQTRLENTLLKATHLIADIEHCGSPGLVDMELTV